MSAGTAEPSITEAVSRTIAVGGLDRATSNEGALSRRNLLIAGALALGSLLVFVTLKLIWKLPIYDNTASAYFHSQAEALLKLRWNVDLAYPTANVDLVQLHGKWYSVFGLFPALLELPFIVVMRSHFSDTFFFTALSAINVGLLYLLFEQVRESGFSRKTRRENAIWATLLYLGSTGLVLSLGGGVWYEGHVAACFCLLLTLILALRRHFAWAAVALTCGFFSRSTLLFGFPLLLYLAWENGCQEERFVPFLRSLWTRRPDWRLVPWRRLTGVATVMMACLALYLLRNWSMFGNPLESGYGIQQAQRYPFIKFGVLSVRYIPANVINNFLNVPRIIFPNAYSYAPTIDIGNGRTGTSVFLTTPLFFRFLFVRNWERSRLRVALWVTIACATAFLLLYYTAGYMQFGTRYLFDIFPFAWLVMATNDIHIDWRVYALGIFAIVLDAFGAYALYCHVFSYDIYNELHKLRMFLPH